MAKDGKISPRYCMREQASIFQEKSLCFSNQPAAVADLCLSVTIFSRNYSFPPTIFPNNLSKISILFSTPRGGRFSRAPPFVKR
jgi:hypothetical protein